MTFFLWVLWIHLPTGGLGFLKTECKGEGGGRERGERQTPPFHFLPRLEAEILNNPRAFASAMWFSKSLPTSLPHTDATAETSLGDGAI